MLRMQEGKTKQKIHTEEKEKGETIMIHYQAKKTNYIFNEMREVGELCQNYKNKLEQTHTRNQDNEIETKRRDEIKYVEISF